MSTVPNTEPRMILAINWGNPLLQEGFNGLLRSKFGISDDALIEGYTVSNPENLPGDRLVELHERLQLACLDTRLTDIKIDHIYVMMDMDLEHFYALTSSMVAEFGINMTLINPVTHNAVIGHLIVVDSTLIEAPGAHEQFRRHAAILQEIKAEPFEGHNYFYSPVPDGASITERIQLTLSIQEFLSNRVVALVADLGPDSFRAIQEAFPNIQLRLIHPSVLENP